MKKHIKLLFPAILMSFFICQTDAQNVGEKLPEWTLGTMDIHEISTGRGSSTFFILPDGTTMLYDAGEFTQTSASWRCT